MRVAPTVACLLESRETGDFQNGELPKQRAVLEVSEPGLFQTVKADWRYVSLMGERQPGLMCHDCFKEGS
jgi:hypothetical protein